jgi:hypothetical protein
LAHKLGVSQKEFSMNNLLIRILIISLLSNLLFAQNRQSANHTRGILHQTVYNTGELGRAYDNGSSGMVAGYSSMEWPPNSTSIVGQRKYSGQHNSFGGGLYLAGSKNNVVQVVACGAVTTAQNGQVFPVAGVYSYPGTIMRVENFPVMEDGNLNPLYNPNEAEEIIIANWTTPLNISVQRTSRAWSFRGYDSFIIYEYDLVNTDTVSITDAFVGWGYGFCPSMFGYERLYDEWSEGMDMRARDMYARFDFKRWMSYNHERTGKPDADYFELWSQPGDRGGLNSPQAVGILPLHFDHDHLAVRGNTSYPTGSDSLSVWDSEMRLKQPYTNRYENTNLYIDKLTTWMDITSRKTSAFGGSVDSISFLPTNADDWAYWKGRAKPSSTLGWKQPVTHGYVFGPYTFPPNEHVRFSIAEVVGYGPGIASDSIYSDMGGGVEASGNVFHPVPSWYKELSYASAGGVPPVIGSNYLQNHPLPWYVTPGVVSIRDVADRAIQMYSGWPLAKYDTIQFEPANTPAQGKYNSTPIFVPAPAITVNKKYDSTSARYFEEVSWGPQVESFSVPRLSAPFSHYVLLTARHPLGPWVKVDSLAKMDPRYYHNSMYSVRVDSVTIGQAHFFAVISVDVKGNRSGMPTMVARDTLLTGIRNPGTGEYADRFVLEQNFPNPFNPSTTLQYGIPRTSRLRLQIYNVLGQVVADLVDDEQAAGWYQVKWNANVASGMYFYRIDAVSVSDPTIRFVQVKKMLLIK